MKSSSRVAGDGDIHAQCGIERENAGKRVTKGIEKLKFWKLIL